MCDATYHYGRNGRKNYFGYYVKKFLRNILGYVQYWNKWASQHVICMAVSYFLFLYIFLKIF